MWLSILEEEIYSAEFMKILLFKGRCSIGKQSYRKTNLVSQKKKPPQRILQDIKPYNVAQAEHGLVHFKSLELEDYVAFFRSHSEYTDTPQTHYMNIPTNYATAHSIYRKLRLSSYFRSQLTGHSLIANLRRKFGDDVAFMRGNWSSLNSRFH